MKLRLILFEKQGAKHTGAFIGLWLQPGEAKRLAQDEGESARELHITLCYIKNAASLDQEQRAAIRRICREMAAEHSAFHGTVSGAGRFEATSSSDDQDVLYARPSITGLKQFREKLAKKLKAEGIKVSDKFDYTPHITLKYVKAGEEELPDLPKAQLRFNDLVLSFGDRRERIPFGD